MGKALVWGLLACGALSAAPGWIEDYARENDAFNRTCAAKQYAECRRHLERLSELLGGRADVLYNLARVQAQMGDWDTAFDSLLTFVQTGLTFARASKDPIFAPLHDRPTFAEIETREEAVRRPVTRSSSVRPLPEKDLVSEDLAYDAKTRRFFVSSVRYGKILSIDPAGHAADFLPAGRPDTWAILALALDPKARVLWATTAAMPEFRDYKEADDGRTAVLEFSLDSGKQLARFDVKDPGKHALGDMTLSRAGDIYVSDGYGAVYTIDHARKHLERLIGPGTFRSPQTPALAPDQRHLFVPDYTRGISVIDLQTKTATLLPHPANASLAGIDGLYFADNGLIAVQNGTRPPRVIRLSLDARLTRIQAWNTLEANWDGLGQPTHGTIAGGVFYFLANSGWDQLEDNGKPKSGAVFTAPEIRQIPLKDLAR